MRKKFVFSLLVMWAVAGWGAAAYAKSGMNFGPVSEVKSEAQSEVKTEEKSEVKADATAEETPSED